VRVILSKKIGWNFPANDDGQEIGLNDPGIETFKDNPLSSLAREGLQNSADAADESNKPVEVHFKKLELPSSEFPGHAEFKKTLQACRTYAQSSKQTVAFCDKALEVLGGPMLPVLQISDYNTTGLTIGAKNDRTSDWFKLTKSVGVSDKNAGKLGSFGIGKHAPFACSDLRTVFYGTKDINQATAFQGVSKLVTHFRDKKVRTQGTGYFGIRTGNAPLPDFKSVPLFERKRVGADVYVMGFHDYPDWESQIIKTVIESFFVAIHQGKLIVKVGKTTLNKTSLPDQIKKHYAESDSNFYADAYYQALTSDDALEFIEEDFLGMGTIRLRLLENKDFRKKVAMFRRSGMKIFDKGHFQTPLRFAGVFTVEGQALDAMLRTLENPNHSLWEAGRGADPASSKKVLRDIYAWVNDKVRVLGGSENVTEVDAEGVSQYLPDDIEDESGTPLQIEAINEEPTEFIEMRVRSTPPSSGPIYEPAEKDQGDGDEDGEQEEGGAFDPTEDDSNESGESDAGGHEVDDSTGSNKTDRGQRRVEISKVRIFCTDVNTGAYRLLFDPSAQGVTNLRVFVIGEVGVEPAPIATYSVNGGKQAIPNGEKGLIGPLALPAGKRAAVDVVLDNGLRCALGVHAYGN
jgi:hypothetical protein